MDKSSLKKFSKSEVIRLLLKQEKKHKIIVVDDIKPVPAPRKSVKQMIKDYEEQPTILDKSVGTPALFR